MNSQIYLNQILPVEIFRIIDEFLFSDLFKQDNPPGIKLMYQIENPIGDGVVGWYESESVLPNTITNRSIHIAEFRVVNKYNGYNISLLHNTADTEKVGKEIRNQDIVHFKRCNYCEKHFSGNNRPKEILDAIYGPHRDKSLDDQLEDNPPPQYFNHKYNLCNSCSEYHERCNFLLMLGKHSLEMTKTEIPDYLKNCWGGVHFMF